MCFEKSTCLVAVSVAVVPDCVDAADAPDAGDAPEAPAWYMYLAEPLLREKRCMHDLLRHPISLSPLSLSFLAISLSLSLSVFLSLPPSLAGYAPGYGPTQFVM